MECKDVDKLKPLDKLLDDQIQEFDSGEEKKCDKDLDVMIWKLGDYENEEPTEAAGEFAEAPPIEEELVEKRNIHGTRGRPYFMAEENVAIARSLSPEPRKARSKAARGNPSRKKKK
ncbi:MAG: hypothetical protein ACXWMH_10425 [Syntrophales bacterium]